MCKLDLISPETQSDLITFAQDLVRIKSLSGHEEEIARIISQKMEALGYDEVIIDAMGNVLGRIGRGEKSILFDAHMDTVAVTDVDQWEAPPFSGEIVNGYLYGRGAVDMKSGAAASIYAGALARQLGWAEGKTIYVSGTVFEEDCDGENLKHLFRELDIRPDYVVICEPSDNLIALGHKGKAQVSITAHGVSAHGSAPEKGVNAIYEMAEIIARVEKLNKELAKTPAPRGSVVLARISSTAASLNAVPSECEIYLDRRIAPGETEQAIRKEMDALVEGKNASWQVDSLQRTSWTGMGISYRPFHMAWRIDLEHPLTRACLVAYQETYDHAPDRYVYWDFSTNAVTPIALGVPTIGFGPGDYKLAHMRNECCRVEQIIEACSFYTTLIKSI